MYGVTIFIIKTCILPTIKKEPLLEKLGAKNTWKFRLHLKLLRCHSSSMETVRLLQKKNKCSKYSNLTVFLTVPHIYPIVNNLGDVQHQRIDQPSSLYQQVFL